MAKIGPNIKRHYRAPYQEGLMLYNIKPYPLTLDMGRDVDT